MPHLRLRMPYDSLDDLAPVVRIATFSYVLRSEYGHYGKLIKSAGIKPE